MRVLGLDPGSRHFGWGVVERNGTRIVHVAHGVIEAGDEPTFGERLVFLERELEGVLRTHRPSAASVEAMFFAKDAQAAVKLGHARAIGMLVCARAGLPIAEYPPTRVKRTVTGRGRAEKSQVAAMVRAVLALPSVPAADAADALAIALTHLSESRAVVGANGPASAGMTEAQKALHAALNPRTKSSRSRRFRPPVDPRKPSSV
ncbi:MAG: crossover junction endodeoxyribonuclease RuvC [Polyangiaceae bacterium]